MLFNIHNQLLLKNGNNSCQTQSNTTRATPMGVVTNVVASFMAARESFERIKDHYPFDQYITSILKVLVPILYALCWDVENGTHNRVGLLLTLAEAPYVNTYKEAFPRPTKRPGIYSTTLDKEGKDIVRAKGKTTHKAKQED